MKKALLYIVYGMDDIKVVKDIKSNKFIDDEYEGVEIYDLDKTELKEVVLSVGIKTHRIKKIKAEISLPVPYVTYMLVEYEKDEEIAIYKDVIMDEYNTAIESLKNVAWGIFLDTYGPAILSDEPKYVN